VASRNPVDVERPAQLVVLDAVPLASGTAFQAGLPDGLETVGLSQGPGFGGGVGEGIGTGIGSGTGPGIGPGSGGGFGGGVYRLGGGVVPPTLLKQVIPKYTDGALERRIQGTVVLEVVVTRDGIPSDIRVVRSLDPAGLDGQAVQAVRDWRFNPGRFGATPVDVLVTIVLDFRIH
jgi:TonB family protein